MGTFDVWQPQLDELRRGVMGAMLSDVCGGNPSSWRDGLPQSAPAGAADADYLALEDRLYGLLADLLAIDEAWEQLAKRRTGRVLAPATAIAAKLAAGQPVEAADVVPVGAKAAAADEVAAESLVMQATAARRAIAELSARMQKLARARAAAWAIAARQEWQRRAAAARAVQRAANRAAAEAEEAFTAHLWTHKLPSSVMRGTQRMPEDGGWAMSGPDVVVGPRWIDGESGDDEQEGA